MAIDRRDLVWLLAIPFYLVVGTLRHEGSHALGALVQGGEIDWFQFWPRVSPGRLLGAFGMVVFDRALPWTVAAAPYIVDLVTFAIFFYVCLKVTQRSRAVWLNLVIVGLLSPLVNSSCNYWIGLSDVGDVAWLFAELPRAAVHLYFVGTLLVYSIATVFVLRRRRPSGPGLRRAGKPGPERSGLARTAIVAAALGALGILGEVPIVALGLQPSRREILLQQQSDACVRLLPTYVERNERAERACGLAVSDSVAAFGDANAITVSVSLALASYDAAHGLAADAADLYARTSEAIRASRGASHPLFARAAWGYAETLRSNGEYERALPLFEDLVRVDDLRAQFRLGEVLLGRGLVDQAYSWFVLPAAGGHEPAREKVADCARQMSSDRIVAARLVSKRRRLALLRRTRGDDDSATLGALTDLATYYRWRGDYDSAERLYAEAVDRRTHLDGADSPLALHASNGLAMCYDDQGRLAEAESLYREAIDRARRSQGDESLVTLMLSNNLARVLIQRNEQGEAEALVRTVSEAANAHPPNWRGLLLAYAAYNRGCLAALRGQTETAYAHLRRAVELGWAEAGISDAPSLAALRDTDEFSRIVDSVLQAREKRIRSAVRPPRQE